MEVFKLIKEGPIHCDNIAYNTGLDISTVYSILTILELKGMIKELTGRTLQYHNQVWRCNHCKRI